MSSVALIVFGLVTLLGLVSLLPPLASRLKLPYSVLLALAGCALGILIQVQPEAKPGVADDLLTALKQFEISAEAIIVIFLPALLFEAALAVDLRRLADDIAPIITMAVVAVVICTLVVGFTLSLASQYGLLACLLLGAIVATTDPAAVIGIFREVGAPRRLLTLVEGESLLNDAAAIALFGMLVAMLLDPASAGPGSAVVTFLMSAIGGAIVGFAMGIAATTLFRFLDGWPRAEITLTITLAYLSFFITDHYLHLSGVVACVSAGLVVGSARRTRFSQETAEQLEGAWGQVGFVANSMIFLLAAMFVPRFIGDIGWGDAGLIALLYLATIAARAVSVFGLLPGLERLGLMQRIDNRFKSVLLWGGLRGAVSLALALSVTENEQLPENLRNFIAAAVTGFVLLTLFINGTTLRALIRVLQLNRLSAVALGVRDRAAVMTLAEVREQVAEAAERGRIDRKVVDAVLGDLDGRLAVERSACAPFGSGDGALGRRQTIRVGLTVLTARETARYLDLLHSQVVERRVAEQLLAHAQHLRDAVRVHGGDGDAAEPVGDERRHWDVDRAFAKTWARDLRYDRNFRLALVLQNRFGYERLLAHALADRFELLVNQRRILGEMTAFARDRLGPMLGEEVTEVLIKLTANRAKAVEDALLAFKLQYPSFAEALQRQHLERLSREMERRGYRGLLDQGVIGGEVAQALTESAIDRYPGIDRRPRLDTKLTAPQLVARVPLFANLDEAAQTRISHRLRPRLTLPNERILRKGTRGESMFFIASGAVRLSLPSGEEIELGSGAFFGELALITGRPRSTDVISLGFCRLLELVEVEFRRLLAEDEALKREIEGIAKERLSAAK
ncbi:MAG TPA: cation:proton antiporter [Dongiaceae bacterium]|jgi:CPA1 family monovalent cation:H+ antiporter|nr:cation:proton antiporter [Dongiaceae bacterium]